MGLSITGNPVLDFVIIQTTSILYLSEAALPLIKWQHSEDASLRSMSVQPIAAWYEKAAGTRMKKTSKADRPCLKTTGFSIQVLSRLAAILPDYRLESCLAKPFSNMEWKTTAALQLQYCLEYQKEYTCTREELASVLEGGAYFLQSVISPDDAGDYQLGLQSLYDNLSAEIDTLRLSTMELACIIRAISAWQKQNNVHQRSGFLTSLVLEVLNRKNRSGLFHYGIDGFSSASMGQQFFILDALLRSYTLIQLDYVLEEIFEFFSNLYQIAYVDAFDLFAFKRKSISYTAFDTGALLTCLNNIARYSADQSDQKAVINNIIDSFLEFLIQSYNQNHNQEFRKLLRWIFLYREGKAQIKDKPYVRTVFPKRVRLMYPRLEVDWDRKGIVNQGDIFFLCSSLLSLLDEESRFSPAAGIKLDISSLRSLKALFDFFLGQ